MKLRIDLSRLYSKRGNGDLAGATAEMEVSIIDGDGKVMGSAHVSFDGKIGSPDPDGKSSYIKEYDLGSTNDSPNTWRSVEAYDPRDGKRKFTDNPALIAGDLSGIPIENKDFWAMIAEQADLCEDRCEERI